MIGPRKYPIRATDGIINNSFGTFNLYTTYVNDDKYPAVVHAKK